MDAVGFPAKTIFQGVLVVMERTGIRVNVIRGVYMASPGEQTIFVAWDDNPTLLVGMRVGRSISRKMYFFALFTCNLGDELWAIS